MKIFFKISAAFGARGLSPLVLSYSFRISSIVKSFVVGEIPSTPKVAVYPFLVEKLKTLFFRFQFDGYFIPKPYVVSRYVFQLAVSPCGVGVGDTAVFV
ncbi:MAG: hypothetical protein A3I44_06355 [Candidatus Sungbacteria bacterium RIFCSPLOWO2_02_FULL_51_17]|nr:MAG: hypothetical protein A3I44_06355 [Candidatus Sungbacteria bacterium RIFCSPLOWO2_02_FULL_51_17]